MKKINTKIKKQERLIKTIVAFLCYFVYSQVFSSLFGSSIIINFIADIIFLIGIVLAYKDNLSEDYKDLKKNYNIKKIIKIIVFWVIIIFVFNIIMGALTEALIPNMDLDNNTQAINSLFQVSSLYTIFKTMIFAIVAEELLFRESVHDIIKNKWMFIIISSIIYTIINFVWTGFTEKTLWNNMLSYFVPSIVLSYAYYKNKSNIIVLMLIKFVYQLIPLTILLLGL